MNDSSKHQKLEEIKLGLGFEENYRYTVLVRTGMVKRKAEISLDEWLERGASAAEVKSGHKAAVTSEAVTNPIPTAKEVPSEGKVEVAASVPTDVAPTDSDEHKWFWRLLELSGYERW